jgi:hypothetical protein
MKKEKELHKIVRKIVGGCMSHISCSTYGSCSFLDDDDIPSPEFYYCGLFGVDKELGWVDIHPYGDMKSETVRRPARCEECKRIFDVSEYVPPGWE